ncbi:MAG: DnaJ domain-containing protein [Pseudomonadota bacterium]
MSVFLLGIIILVVILLALNWFTTADPRALARAFRLGGGIVLGLMAAGFAITGRWFIAAALGMVALSLFGVRTPLGGAANFGARVNRSGGQTSRVRSSLLEMTLDHDTGDMDGEILAGAHQGRSLSDLSVDEVIDLYSEADAQSRALLEAYLDRTAPGWRENAETEAPAGEGPVGAGDGPMTPEEAEQILGLAPRASAEEIREAHRRLMKRMHPDQGGSTYLAAKINEAKEVLLRRHGVRS